MPERRAISRLALPLLVLGIRADTHHHAVAADDLAVVTACLNGCGDLHDSCFLAPGLLEPVGDASAREVVWRQLDANPVAGQNADEVHPQLAADMGQDAVLVLQLNGEHRVRQRLDDRPLYFDSVLLGHRRRQTPSVLISGEWMA